MNNYGAEISYYDEEFDHAQQWNSSPVLLQMQLDELNMIMESMDSPYQIPNQSPLPFNSKTDTADSRSCSSSSASLPSSSSTMTSSTNQSNGHAFQRYRCLISAVMENGEEKTAVGQNMMKKAHSMLRNMSLLKEQRKTEELKPAVNQKQHMASERRRRERLNAGYHSLRKLLPPGSKKDKTSVLRKTLSCIKTLKTEVHELQEENRIIQQHYPSSTAAAAQEHYYIFPGKRVEVQIIDRYEEASEMDLIDLVVMVRVPCDLMRVVLRVLECIRERRDLGLLLLDAGARYTRDQMSMSATLKLAIQRSTWNERTFKELITGAALMALNA